MNKVTFGFIVGGDDIYYKNLMRACESLERVKQPHEILIIDMDNRLNIDDPNVKIVNAEAEKVENEDDRNYFQPHIWKKRYELYKHLETDYCFYMDTDTVVINDRTDELIEQAEDKFHMVICDIMKPIESVLEKVSVSDVLDLFVKRRQQMFLVKDEFGTTTGLITLEDAIETLLGVEIVDEHDNVVDMRKLATAKMMEKDK